MFARGLRDVTTAASDVCAFAAQARLHRRPFDYSASSNVAGLLWIRGHTPALTMTWNKAATMWNESAHALMENGHRGEPKETSFAMGGARQGSTSAQRMGASHGIGAACRIDRKAKILEHGRRKRYLLTLEAPAQVCPAPGRVSASDRPAVEARRLIPMSSGRFHAR